MSAIKRFFEKKKLDAKFKHAGEGHKLSDNQPREDISSKPQTQQPRQQPTISSAKAGEAAIARIAALQQNQSKRPASKSATWKHQTEVENVKKEINSVEPKKIEDPIVKDHSLAVDSVYFTCPVYPACLPKDELYQHIHECLKEDLKDEPLMISVTMIHSLNQNKQKRDACIPILCKYIQNILDHPGEEKYRKIRKKNKVFQERVKGLIGIDEFLIKGCGFECCVISNDTGQSETGEEFYVLSVENANNTDHLVVCKEMLVQGEPLEIIIDRNLKVLSPNSQNASRIHVPNSFFAVTSDEVKREQQERSENLEKSSQLRTKAMREADKSASKRFYKFAVIRVRMPDGVIIQGTFKSTEKLKDIQDFVREQLSLDWLPFNLLDTVGKSFSDENATLNALKIVPAALLNFHMDATVTSDIAISSQGKIHYLKEDILALMQNV